MGDVEGRKIGLGRPGRGVCRKKTVERRRGPAVAAVVLCRREGYSQDRADYDGDGSYTRGAVSFVNGRAARSRQRKGLAGVLGLRAGDRLTQDGVNGYLGGSRLGRNRGYYCACLLCGSRVQQWEGV